MRQLYTLLIIALGLLSLFAPVAGAAMRHDGVWRPDSLGDGYQYRYVDQGTDYSGAVRSTIIRKVVPGSRVGILYVHGFNDYFFQTEMGDYFVDHGISFYAVDLRKYGRSLMPGQRRFEVRDLREYFPDIDSTLADMRQAGIADVVLMGHSTGGLITSYYLSYHQPPEVKGLILNSPFLDWNLSKFNEKLAVPMVGCIAKFAPNMKINQGKSTAYSESLLADYHGRWHYDTSKKLMVSPPVTAGWIRAIDRAQARVQRGDIIHVPILLLHSDKSVEGTEWSEAFNHGDAVLDVKDISKYGRRLGPSVTEKTIKGGLHDLVLSSPEAESETLGDMLQFITGLGLIAPAS